MRKTRPATCEQCGTSSFLTPSHTIAQKDCKNYGVTELIWDQGNIVIECQDDHRAYENGTASMESLKPRYDYIYSKLPLIQERMEEKHPGEGAKKATELWMRYVDKIQEDGVPLRREQKITLGNMTKESYI